ncbi:hypothetical protein RE432_18490 [Pusillimonas sp. SM2304]|uniref:Lar family restriction alleviation protein n=1 Tax=Pusillimonas sp. SM2304 TaxID=3073241 RepID=UPI002876931A|nr:Lar family restriction alleviation protein [Pusillimonas sp. SM2304]MDS1142427.1 hypothetical protein [Pusillimonas sp. SM2304]
MTTKTDELEPCPCCGGEAAFNTTRTTCRETIKLNKRDTGYGVNCVVCGINNRGLVLGYESKALAAEAWNRRAALREQDREDAEITAYALPGGISVERSMQRDGTYLWAVRDSYEHCLSRSGQWDYEPFPSARTDEWIGQHRFSSAAFAIDHARRIEGEGE